MSDQGHELLPYVGPTASTKPGGSCASGPGGSLDVGIVTTLEGDDDPDAPAT